jgi:hypothetical protein
MMRNLYALLLAFSQLTGYLQSDLGGCYQITQNGSKVWWPGESLETMLAKNIFYGTVTGNTLNGVWCDLPSNTNNGFSERLSLRIEGSFKLVKTGETSPYMGSLWTKLNGPCGSGTAQGNLNTNVAGTCHKKGEISMPCHITQDGVSLLLFTDNNVSQVSFTSQNMIYANKWNTFGILSSNGHITWGNQTWTGQAGTIGGGGNTVAVLDELSVPGTTPERTNTSNVLQQGKKYLLQISRTFIVHKLMYLERTTLERHLYYTIGIRRLLFF